MRLLPALALSAALFGGGCTNPDGSLNVPATVALGAGAAIAGLAIASAADRPRYARDGYRYRSYHRHRATHPGWHGHRPAYRRW